MTKEAIFDLGNELSLHATLKPERPSAGEKAELLARLVSGYGQTFKQLQVRSYPIDEPPSDWIAMDKVKLDRNLARHESHFVGILAFSEGVNRIEFLNREDDYINIDWTIVARGLDSDVSAEWIESSTTFTWYTRLIRRDPLRAREPIDDLIQKHATANIRDDAGISILSVACRWGDVTLARDLLTHGADPNGGGISPPIANCLGKRELIALLLEFGSDANAKNSDGKTSLMDAVQYAELDSIEMLLNAGADLAAKDRGGRTAIDYARSKNADANDQIRRMLEASSGG